MGGKMKKLFAILCLGLIVGGCESENLVIQCGGYSVEITMSQDGETLNANINGDEMVLTHAISASGARYVGELNDTIVTLWNQGNDWTMFLNDDAPIECTSK